MTVKFRPLGDKILVKRVEAESVSPGGIIIPDTAKEKPSKGEVIAIGAGRVLENGNILKLDVKVGDIIVFTKWSGTEVKVGSDTLLIMKESDVLGIMEE